MYIGMATGEAHSNRAGIERREGKAVKISKGEMYFGDYEDAGCEE